MLNTPTQHWLLLFVLLLATVAAGIYCNTIQFKIQHTQAARWNSLKSATPRLTFRAECTGRLFPDSRVVSLAMHTGTTSDTP